jgi:hypothetical protein
VPRPSRSDAVAAVLAVAAGILGVVAGTGPLLPILAVGVVAAGFLRAVMTQVIVAILICPLLAVIANDDASLLGAAILLGASSVIFLVRALAAPPLAQQRDEVVAARIVLTLAALVTAFSLGTFVSQYA